jgi:chaperonin cofactor prefoldin
LASVQRETRVNRVTNDQIVALPESTAMYRSVGKAFLLAGKADVVARLEQEHAELLKSQRVLAERQEFLERRVTSNTSNLRELTAGL